MAIEGHERALSLSKVESNGEQGTASENRNREKGERPMMQAPRGMRDILPDEATRWQALEARIREFAARFGYGEIRTPVVEHTEVFQRTSGESSDIVQREMYTFSDRGGRSLSLRPEGTAGVVRAYLEHGMASLPQPVRLYYLASMFRYDRPQRGRYRMHYQFGAECLGSDAPAADVEVLSLPIRLIQSLGLTEVTVRLNSIGDARCRPQYVEALREYFRPHAAHLSADSRRRLDSNPLRILESRERVDQEVVRDAPLMPAYLCEDCRAHFEQVKHLFTLIGIHYVEDPYIVRGLDYYTRTAAEIHSGRIGGAQHQVLGGGRYDGLAQQLEGPRVPGVGFGLGLERLMLVLEAEDLPVPEAQVTDRPQIFLASTSAAAADEAFQLLDQMRTAGYRAVGELMGRSLRAQMKAADKIHADYTIILGDDELARRVVKIRVMASGEQQEFGRGEILGALAEIVRR